ncbi:MAG: metallophosphoesterase [Defluviitaleaceae bacterium]|nr:metallophosphoesterase [Defluviitaleaceae bacterium]
MRLKIKQLEISREKRLICISDIHGELDLFKRLLEKVEFCDNDTLVLLGDLFLKGSQPRECLKYIIELAKRSNVHVLRGNCDWDYHNYLDELDKAWLEELPHIIESDEFVFVHAGIESADLQKQDPAFCMRNDAFLESYNGIFFEKWVVVGHWPNINYCHDIPCDNPIINRDKRIIAIDGGIVVKDTGQLNAFIADSFGFSWMYADKLPVMTANRAQDQGTGTLNIGWLNRFVDIVEDGEEFSFVHHKASGKKLHVPTNKIWQDDEGNMCVGSMATDNWLAISEGDVISIVETFSDRIYAKKDGISGWIWND